MMRTIPFILFIYLCMTPALFGQGNSQRIRGAGMPPVAILMALDANQDGKISAVEIKNAAIVLKALDQNKDGKLSSEEMGWPPNFGRIGRSTPGRGGRGGSSKPRRPNPDAGE